MRTVIIDYESGNLHSARKAFERVAGAGERICLSGSVEDILAADRIVLPGDGAFAASREALCGQGAGALYEALSEAVLTKARPFMGICVGMQLMATTGFEGVQTRGLDWIEGEVHRLQPEDAGLKIPHMGWNNLCLHGAHPILEGIKEGGHAYFIHSYAFKVKNKQECLASTDYGGAVSAIIGRDNLFGTQLHPEKSQALGLKIIENFLNWTP